MNFFRNKDVQTQLRVHLGLTILWGVAGMLLYGANGWAFNGNGKISENITINANTIERPSYGWRSIYPYAFEFYSVYAKDLKVTNNKVTNGGGVNWGKLSYNFLLENNDLGGASFGIVNPLGSVTIRNNTTTGVRGQSYSITASKSLPWVESEDSEFYLSPEERKADVLFEGNSTGGVVSNIVVTDPANEPPPKHRQAVCSRFQ